MKAPVEPTRTMLRQKHPGDLDIPGVPQMGFTYIRWSSIVLTVVHGQAPERWAVE